MNFGEFLNAFGTGYKNLIPNRALTKPYFCRYLLCSITKDETIVMYINGIEDKAHERGESAFQAFYRNNDRRSLHPIAESILNSNSIDTSKFMIFLEEYCKGYNKEKLLMNFKKYLPSTFSSTLFKDITNEFIRILKEEACKADKRLKEPVSLNNANSANVIDDSLEAKMSILVKALIITGREIAEFKPSGVGDNIRRSRLVETLKDDFEKLLALSNQLSQDESDDNTSIYSDIRSSVQSLTAENFILSTNQFMIVSVQNYHIHRLSELLRKAKE